MNTIYRRVALALIAFSVLGCVREEIAEESASCELKAVIEGETRTVMSGLDEGMYYPLWSENDRIAVFADNDRTASLFTLSEGAGTRDAVFSGIRKGGTYNAVYPYDIAGECNDNMLTVTLPGNQSYVPDSFGADAYPMVAKGSDGVLQFRNLCAVLNVSLQGLGSVRSVKVTANDPHAFLSGSATVDMSNPDEPVLTFTEGRPSVTLNCKAAAIPEDECLDCMITIPAGTYRGGFTVEVDTFEEVVKTVIDADLTFRRSEVRTLKGIEIDAESLNLYPYEVPDNEIWYISRSGSAIELCPEAYFGTGLVSNEYMNGKGVLEFESAVTMIDCGIGGLMFDSEDLLMVILPDGIEYVSMNPFRTSVNLNCFYGKVASEDGRCLIVDGRIVSFAPHGVEELTIQEGVVSISNYAFYYAESLRSINFPDSFRMVESGHAFEGTVNVESITGKNVLADGRSLVVDGKLIYLAAAGLEKYVTPEGVNSLGDMVLGFHDDLKEIVVSDEVVSIDGPGYMFNFCPSLETITVSAGLQNLGYDPFSSDWYCQPNLRTVYSRAPFPPSVDHNVREYDFNDLTIYVPEESLDLYLSSSDWEPYSDYIEPYDFGNLDEFKPDYYISTDYSADGTVVTLQTAAYGNGINVVLMGDGYSDRQIADGLYEDDMEYLYSHLFDEEPYRTYRNLFNVHYVNVVSATEGFEHGNTSLDCWFGDGTLVGGNDMKCFEYAQNVLTDSQIDEALIIVAMNSDAYAGTCYMYYPTDASKDYGNGPSVAYFPKGTDEEVFAQLLHHEANGHGFAKLADEYAYEYNGEISSEHAAETMQQQNGWGWWRNVDFTSDLNTIRWSHFLNDSRYDSEGLGAFEGALTYWSGVWRPTEYSTMRYNTGGFNAPSRESIYYRLHKLAYGDSWEYDYEDFVEYDAINRTASEVGTTNLVERRFEPTAPPVVVKSSWKKR